MLFAGQKDPKERTRVLKHFIFGSPSMVTILIQTGSSPSYKFFYCVRDMHGENGSLCDLFRDFKSNDLDKAKI